MTTNKVFFGSLEQAIMDIVWKKESATVRDVVESLQSSRQIAYTTVMTVMNRLVAYTWLRRSATPSGAFAYTPTHSREAYSRLATRQSVKQLIARYGDAALVQFMEQLDSLPAEKLSRLKRNLQSKK